MDEVTENKRRGRKPGSKNKPKADAEGQPTAPAKKRPAKSASAASGTDVEPAAKKVKTAKTDCKVETSAPVKNKKAKRERTASGTDGLAEPTVEPKPVPSTAPIDVDDDDDVVVVPKTAPAGRAALSDEIQADIDAIHELVEGESFEPKHRFPPALKPPLHDLALKALELGDFGEQFFQAMADIFPYNLFTMRKHIVRDIYPERVAGIEARRDTLIEKFGEMIDEAMPASEAAYETAMEKYTRDREAWDAAHPPAPAADEDAPLVPMPPPSGGPDASMDVDAPETSVADASVATTAPVGREPTEPKKRFKWTQDLRDTFYEIVRLDTELIDLEAQKLELEKSDKERPSELKARQRIYARLIKLWPDGWINSTILSREFSTQKKKHAD